MSIKNLLIVTAEPKSVFLEILFKYLNSNNKFIKKKRLVLVGNKKIIDKEAKINNYKKKIYQIYSFQSAIKDKLNIINVEIKKKNYKKYISECFKKSISIIKKNQDIALINGPVDKKTFLNNPTKKIKTPKMKELIFCLSFQSVAFKTNSKFL